MGGIVAAAAVALLSFSGTAHGVAPIPPLDPNLPPVPAAAIGPVVAGGAPDVAADAFMVIDATTGTVLASKDPHTPRLSASTAKTVTALTALRLGSTAKQVQISMLAGSPPAMRLGLNAGQFWNMGDLMWAMMLQSSNDSAYAIAEGTSGTLEAFKVAMNDTARLIGMRDSTFADPSGLDRDSTIGANMVSAFDLAVVGRVALANPTLNEMVSTISYQFTGGDNKPYKVSNHNKALSPKSKRYYPGTIGVKTGFTESAKGTFIVAAQRDGRTIMVTLLGANDIYGSSRALFDWAFTATNAASTGIGEVMPALVPIASASELLVSGQPVERAPVAGVPVVTTVPADPAATVAPETLPYEEVDDTDIAPAPAGSESTLPGATSVVVRDPITTDPSNDNSNAVLVAAGTGTALLALLTIGRFPLARRVPASRRPIEKRRSSSPKDPPSPKDQPSNRPSRAAGDRDDPPRGRQRVASPAQEESTEVRPTHPRPERARPRPDASAPAPASASSPERPRSTPRPTDERRPSSDRPSSDRPSGDDRRPRRASPPRERDPDGERSPR
jgi:D-alanyl-D-alanine carboxypeptidase